MKIPTLLCWCHAVHWWHFESLSSISFYSNKYGISGQGKVLVAFISNYLLHLLLCSSTILVEWQHYIYFLCLYYIQIHQHNHRCQTSHLIFLRATGNHQTRQIHPWKWKLTAIEMEYGECILEKNQSSFEKCYTIRR